MRPSERGRYVGVDVDFDVDVDVDVDFDGDGDVNLVGTLDGDLRRGLDQNILVSIATMLSNSSIPRAYLSGFTSFLSFRTSRDEADSIASPRAIL